MFVFCLFVFKKTTTVNNTIKTVHIIIIKIHNLITVTNKLNNDKNNTISLQKHTSNSTSKLKCILYVDTVLNILYVKGDHLKTFQHKNTVQ